MERQNQIVKLTTSWDDGTVSDLRIAELLAKFRCTGTFYVCPREQRCHNERLLTNDEIRSLSAAHEIGAHTMTHPHLPALSDEDAKQEIQKSKNWIEAVTGRPCTMFCYPFGDHDGRIQKLVEESGFRGARTVTQWQFQRGNPFALGTSLQIYPFPIRPTLNRRMFDPLRSAWYALRPLAIPVAALRHWLPMAKAVFRSALKKEKPWVHLWGHGWEIERYGMWGDLEAFLTFIQEQNIDCVPNSEIL